MGLQNWRNASTIDETLFSETSKVMSHACRNVEGFELEWYSMKGTIYRDCDIYQVPSEQGRKLSKERLDFLTKHLFTNKRRHTEGIAVVVQQGNSRTIRPKYRQEQRKQMDSRPFAAGSWSKTPIAIRRWRLAGRRELASTWALFYWKTTQKLRHMPKECDPITLQVFLKQ